ncbi:CubicO group peptidase (beta-lactamase class C family) [Sphingomonas naasensis]|uniref:Class A beta-lactamase-related serine hydrolase n=1 Tax=Sphingomonas naasensis TaxID=1344951 RepID=A0A4S1WQS3_9SPHN|nr:serine hydrolase domain-containing protein [Sphingomonas naasensis]NIJ18437.1 CubicO group peptidase (beta-lactamase class C family) [Sphingomonas naasensis]TGX45701.1 class A beta-lactamase-related serine hydrolase [Sphingomonas naasensis]
MKGWMLAGALALGIGAGPALGQVALDKADTSGLRKVGAEVLFWSQAQRDANFPHMEKIFPGHVVKAGGKVHALPAGEPLGLSDAEIDAFIASQNISGLIVLQDGKVRLERYARGYTPQGRWTSFSVAKSFTSSLVGAAIRDGYIKSVDEPVTRYIPELAGSGYDGVTIAQLLTMTSGVRWNEDYTDAKSDVARMFLEPVPAGEDPTIFYMKKLPRESAPGSKWVYKTGETNLIGVLVMRATKKSLADYLSEKIWRPYGMEQDAFWMIDPSGHEVSGCCLSVSLRDYARLGQFVLEGGKGVVPANWYAESTRSHAEIGRPGFGYGYQWWSYPQGRFGAQGIFGQSIRIDPKSRTVIAISAAAAKATDGGYGEARTAFMDKLFAAAAGK